MNYQEKAITFWKWFESKEAFFRDHIQQHQYTVVNDCLKEQLQPLLPDVIFEISYHKNRFLMELMPMGNTLNRVMMLSLLFYRPTSLKNWDFYNYRTAKMGTMKYHDIAIDGSDILVFPMYDKKQNRFKIKMKADKLQTFPDEEKFQICYALLYEYIGELLCESLVEEVEFIRDFSYKFRYKKQTQMQLQELRAWLCEQVGMQNVIKVEQQGLLYESFHGKPSPFKKQPRYDIVSGYSSFIEVCHEYYEEEKPITNYLKEQGIRPSYMYVESTDKECIKEMMFDFQKALALHGIVFGVSEALGGTYIDYLIYDEQECFDSLQKKYATTNMQIYNF